MDTDLGPLDERVTWPCVNVCEYIVETRWFFWP